MKFTFISLTVLTCVCLAGSSPADQRHGKKAPVNQPPQPMPQVAPPPAPLTLQQQPALPPQVAFQDGQLTITAQNSVLGEILRAVHSRTGATVDVPSNANERVVGIFGPGPARDVLASLLNGSNFNYVFLGSATNPAGLDRVMLFSKTGGADAPNPAPQTAAVREPPPILTPGVAPHPPNENAEGGDDSANSDEFSDDMADQDQLQQVQPAQAEDQQQPNPQAPFNGQPGVKTPEQLLQELQQRQQQQQQGLPGTPVAPNQPQP